MAPFPLPRAELIALFLESLLFGAFAILFFISIWILMYRQKNHGRSRLNKWMLVTATLMFILSLMHLILDVIRAVEGFIVDGTTPDGTATFFSKLDHPTHVGKTSIYVLQTLVGDGFVSYRLFIVWNRAWYVLVLPSMLLLATAIAGVGTCIEFSRSGSGAIFANTLVPWITSFFSLSLTTNVLATLLITGRIVWSNYKVQKYRTGYVPVTLWGVVETIVQSAAIYSAALISLMATYLADNNAQYICLDAVQPIIGIVFTLIIIRVGLGETASEASKGHHSLSVSSGDPRISTAPAHHGQQYPMRPLAINVSVARTRDNDSFDQYTQRDIVHVKKDPDLESGDGDSP